MSKVAKSRRKSVWANRIRLLGRLATGAGVLSLLVTIGLGWNAQTQNPSLDAVADSELAEFEEVGLLQVPESADQGNSSHPKTFASNGSIVQAGGITEALPRASTVTSPTTPIRLAGFIETEEPGDPASSPVIIPLVHQVEYESK